MTEEIVADTAIGDIEHAVVALQELSSSVEPIKFTRILARMKRNLLKEYAHKLFELESSSYGELGIFCQLNSRQSSIRIDKIEALQGLTEAVDSDSPVSIEVDEERRTWRVTTPFVTLSGTIVDSSDEEDSTAEVSIAHDNHADMRSHFQNMRLPPPTLHVARHSTQVLSSLPIGGCPTRGKLAPYEYARKERDNQKCEKEAKEHMKRKGNPQKIPSKSACNHWQVPLLRSLSILGEVSRSSPLSLMNIQRLLEAPSPCCPSSGMLCWSNSGLEPWGIFPSSSCSSNASVICENKGASISSFSRGVSN